MAEKHRPLSSNELGEKGENRFREICADAKLICNSSDRDLTGWDAIVEFPFQAPGENSTLDNRIAPLSCHFQIKTIWEENESIRLQLSSAERLAKELKPAFIYVWKARDVELVDAYLIHVIGEPLAVILKRLRTEHANATGVLINKAFIEMSPRKYGRQIATTGAALKAAIIEERTSNPYTYVERKKRQLAELGFESQRYDGQIDLGPATREEIVEGLLGLKRIPVSKFESFETRFGIRLPISTGPIGADDSGFVEFNPNATDHCTVTFRREPNERPSMFDGEVIFLAGPFLPAKEFEILIRTDWFRIRFSTPDKLELTVASKRYKDRYKLDKWRDFCRMFICFIEGRGELQIQPKKFPQIINIPIKQPHPDGEQSGIRQILNTCEALSNVLEHVGITSIDVSLADLETEYNDIIALNACLGGNTDQLGALSFSTERPENAAALVAPSQFAYVNFIEIADTFVAYTIKVDVSPELHEESIQWKSTSLRLFNVQILAAGRAAFGNYADGVRLASSSTGMIKREIGERV